METTTIILIVASFAIVIMIYLRFFKKENDNITLEEKRDELPGKPGLRPNAASDDEITETVHPEEESENCVTDEELEAESKEYDIPEEEITRILSDEEIEKNPDEHEKEMIRISNYLVSNGMKNLTGTNFFNLQENIMLDSNSDHADLYTDIHQIFQITENRYIAITDLPVPEKPEGDQNPKKLKGLLGIIECRERIGKGSIEPYDEGKEKDMEKEKGANEQAEIIAEVFFHETDRIIGQNLVHYKDDIDLSAVEALCKEIEKLNRDYFAYIAGSSVYIRILRPARLIDLITMIEILIDFQS
jgi:hypothetical protein